MSEIDISPELLEEIETEFWKNYNGNKKINAAVNALRGSEGLNYKEAYNYSFEVGKSLTGAIRVKARSDILPDGRMYYNIADKALRPMLENNYRLISDYCVKTQNALNERAGIGIKGVAAPINEDRVNGLLNVAAAAQQFDDIVGEFCRECENYSLSVVDEHIKKNAEIQNSAGLSPKIERFCGHSGCDWCSSLAGTYEYEKVKDTGNDVFRRHTGCTCTVVFIPINGRAENAHSKYYIPDKELIELRKNYVGVDRSGRGGIIEGKGKTADSGVFHSMADPMVEVFGAGENSHPQEIKAYQDELKLLGVELIRKDTETLAYSPALRVGNPGTVYISQGASYSAWSHEMQHVRDDYKDGWTGMKILEHPDTRYAREVKAYEIEIQLAQAAGKPDIVKRLKENLEKERREIYGE